VAGLRLSIDCVTNGISDISVSSVSIFGLIWYLNLFPPARALGVWALASFSPNAFGTSFSFMLVRDARRFSRAFLNSAFASFAFSTTSPISFTRSAGFKSFFFAYQKSPPPPKTQTPKIISNRTPKSNFQKSRTDPKNELKTPGDPTGYASVQPFIFPTKIILLRPLCLLLFSNLDLLMIKILLRRRGHSTVLAEVKWLVEDFYSKYRNGRTDAYPPYGLRNWH